MWPFRRRRRAPDPPPDTTAEDEDNFEGANGPATSDDLTNRVVRLHGPLDEALTNEVIQRLLFHQYEDRHSPVVLDIDSPGGLVAHTMAVVDTIGLLETPVQTRCADRAAGGAAFILAAGTRGHRIVSPLATVALVAISSDESDSGRTALDRDRERLAAVLAGLTGQPLQQVMTDLAAGRMFTATAAVEYGLADAVDTPVQIGPAEAAWLAGDDPVKLLEILSDRVSPRKSTLFGVACRRRVEVLDCRTEAVAATCIAELWADGQATNADRQEAVEAVFNARDAVSRMILGDPDGTEPHDGTAAYYAVEAAANLLHLAGNRRALRSVHWSCSRAAWFGDHTPGRTRAAAEFRAQAALARCLFDNPYRPVRFDSRWRTADTVGLARGIYEDRAFDRMPLLADALMDAGCTDEQVLGHCRSDGPHARGCWVVDLILGEQ